MMRWLTPARAAPVEQAELPTHASTRRAIEAMEPSRGRTFDANSEKWAQAAALAGYAAGMDRVCVFRCIVTGHCGKP